MSRDIYGDALRELAKEIKDKFEKFSKALDYDRTYIGIISSVNADGYTIKYNGTEINIKTDIDLFQKNDMVKFCIPCGNKRKAFILTEASGFSGDKISSSSVTYKDDTGTINGTNLNDVIDGLIAEINSLKASVGASEIESSYVDELFK